MCGFGDFQTPDEQTDHSLVFYVQPCWCRGFSWLMSDSGWNDYHCSAAVGIPLDVAAMIPRNILQQIELSSVKQLPNSPPSLFFLNWWSVAMLCLWDTKMAAMHHAGVITGVSSTYVGLLWLNEVICWAVHPSSVEDYRLHSCWRPHVHTAPLFNVIHTFNVCIHNKMKDEWPAS